ncbi:MAG: hypothetical protein E7409_07660 [Ruminococcaceae bacterium]|nr:hypothetical protein [Oscillospiraceae bacterium]
MNKYRLTNTQLKLIALVAMTCDHVGKVLLPGWTFLQIIGRLAFPIFAYMIAEGCRHTRDVKRYFLNMAGAAFVCQVVYFIAGRLLYMCVLVTFSLSIGVICAIRWAQERGTRVSATVLALVLLSTAFVCEVLSRLVAQTGFCVDYGLIGVLLPVAVYLCSQKAHALTVTAVMLAGLGFTYGGIQWFALLAIPLLALYNGERGRLRWKAFFYVYYPLHLAVIYGIDMLI